MNSNNNRSGQQFTTERKLAGKVYTFNSAFKTSEWVKIYCVWQGIPNINYTLGKSW